ncbi:Fc receptor-like protein 5 [Leptonychotes weddellii]|uniref:Fc receptor-like protein 5 n=1 Tax=Leptonychotes weddellii TaxID=9713 RepID=A0A7F8PYV5_LEPWE|nr:Fc receptor-like protein 5 [Leptonychotes weddellii]
MLLWLSVLVLAPVSGQFAPAPKPVISLHPPWTIVFEGEAVTLTCHISHFPAAENKKLYQWYLGTEIIREIPGNTLQVRDSGEYRCQTQGSPLSDGVSLTFSSAKLILQAPHSVFEGDSVTLMCRAKVERVDTAWKTRTLYKNYHVLIDLDENSNFHIEHAGLKDNGEYHCTESETHCCSVSSNTIKIQVQELFPRPVLRANPSLATPGNPVILTCETQLSPQKSDIQLSFHFFRDGHILGSSSKSFLKISIPSIVGNEDPPYYWCEARAGTPSVYKRSQKFQIPVQIPVSRPVLTLSTPGAQAVEGDLLTLSCEAKTGSYPIVYQFLHEEVVLRKKKATFGGMVTFHIFLTAEHSGTYSCTADNSLGVQRSQPVSLSVTGEPWAVSPPSLSGSVSPPSRASASSSPPDVLAHTSAVHLFADLGLFRAATSLPPRPLRSQMFSFLTTCPVNPQKHGVLGNQNQSPGAHRCFLSL